jgi:hypothetical protein
MHIIISREKVAEGYDGFYAHAHPLGISEFDYPMSISITRIGTFDCLVPPRKLKEILKIRVLNYVEYKHDMKNQILRIYT